MVTLAPAKSPRDIAIIASVYEQSSPALTFASLIARTVASNSANRSLRMMTSIDP